MNPYAVLGLAMLSVLATVILAFAMTPRKKQKAAEYGRDDGQADVQPQKPPHRTYDEYDPPTAANAYHTAKGPVPKNISFEKIKASEPSRTFGKRPVGKHPGLAAPYAKGGFVPPTVHPTITLTPRQIERINTQRKLRGKPPFNRKGLTNAIAHPWDRWDVRQPQNSNDWISYLIAYEIFFADHQANTVGGCQGVTIDPNLPYNGHGGEYAGAGASGDWSSNDTRATAAAIEHGIPITTDAPQSSGAGLLDDSGGPATAPSDYPSVGDGPGAANAPDPTPSYTPDPSPSYSAPDPSPSYSAPDPSPSPSFDSSPSPSSGD